MRYSKAVQLVHEFSGALLCVDIQERAESEGFAMKVVLKTVEPPSGARKMYLVDFLVVLICSMATERYSMSDT